MPSYKELDKYYTKPEIVKRCLKAIRIPSYDYIVEPSAGNGAFFKQIPGKNKIGIDIKPEDKQIIRADWFKFKMPGQYKKVLVIGNPPFGKYHSLSDAFLNQALSFDNVKTIAFVLPNTYNKHSRQKIIPGSWRIKKIIALGRDSFTYNGESRHCPCSFFVLDKSSGKDLRIKPSEVKTDDFTFVCPPAQDFFIFGAVPHKIISWPAKNNRGYYIKSFIPKKELISRFKTIKWQGNSCANGGVAWFTKLEIIQQYNKHFPPSKKHFCCLKPTAA